MMKAGNPAFVIYILKQRAMDEFKNFNTGNGLQDNVVLTMHEDSKGKHMEPSC